MATKTIETERVGSESAFLAARTLYTAAAAVWRAERVTYDRVLDAFAHLSRLTGRCMREATTDEAARRFYHEHVVGGIDRETREFGREASGPVEVVASGVAPYTERGLGEWLVARDRLARADASLDERLHERGASRLVAPATAEERRELTLRTHAFEQDALATGEARTWTRETYDGLVGWTKAARDLAHEVGYGPARDRECLARRALEAGLGEHGEDVLVRLVSGSRFERLPAAAVGLFVRAERGETGRVTGNAARAVLDGHVARVVARVEGEHLAVGQTAARRAAERLPSPRLGESVRGVGELTRRAADCVSRAGELGPERIERPERQVLRRGPLGVE